MIATSQWPPASSASRIAPTRPSIMSDGAMMSAPACACTSACSTSTGDGVVIDDAAAVIDQPVVAMRRVGIERDVGQHADLRHRILDGADRAADEIVGVERFPARPRCAATPACWGTAPRRECRASPRPRARSGDAVDGPTADPAQGLDRLLAARPFADEHRQDEVARMQAMLGQHVAHPRARSATAHAKGGIMVPSPVAR